MKTINISDEFSAKLAKHLCEELDHQIYDCGCPSDRCENIVTQIRFLTLLDEKDKADQYLTDFNDTMNRHITAYRESNAKEIAAELGMADEYMYVLEHYDQARMVQMHEGSIYDLDSIVAMEKILNREITYEEFETVNKTGMFDDMGLYNVTEQEQEVINLILDGTVKTWADYDEYQEQQTEKLPENLELY